jgi:hypothetical protein
MEMRANFIVYSPHIAKGWRRFVFVQGSHTRNDWRQTISRQPRPASASDDVNFGGHRIGDETLFMCLVM